MNRLLRSLRKENSKSYSKDLLRRYIENDLSFEERTYVQSQLRTSKEWKHELRKTERYLSVLHNLSYSLPSDRVWKNIEKEVSTIQPRAPRFLWFYTHPRFVKYAGYCFALFFIVVLGLNYPSIEPSYTVVTIQDLNRYRTEAETFYTHHELAGESLLTRESLIAYYTYNNSHE